MTTEFDDLLNIDTPENVIFDYEIAGIGSRFMAALVDSLIIGVLQVAVYIMIAIVASFSGNALSSRPSGAPAWLLAVLILLAFALLWGYYIFFEMYQNGQSPGKRAAGLRVIRSDGTPITISESIIRNLIRIVDFLPLYYGLGTVIMFIDGQSRRLGDMAASTLVVREKETISLESLQTRPKSALPTNPAAALSVPEAGLPELPLERLTADDIHMAEEFLRRRDQLSNSSHLAERILNALYSKMELPPPGLKMYEVGPKISAIVKAYYHRRGR